MPPCAAATCPARCFFNNTRAASREPPHSLPCSLLLPGTRAVNETFAPRYCSSYSQVAASCPCHHHQSPLSPPAQQPLTGLPTAYHLVFALINVYSQFSFKLSTDGSKYKLWHRIFLDICKDAKVHGHITSKSKPVGDDDEDWEAIDSRIKSWFYSACDANLLQIISSDKCTAKDLWDKLDEFFLNNKMHLLHYCFCHNLKNLADALADCDSKIDEIELLMQILRQLPPPYHSIVDVITNTKPFPSLLEAKNMLLLHESHEESIEPHPDTALTFFAALYSSTQSA
ncbi:hypothetical protein OSB04_001746 [Centaurea solstitialis]|uniref:Uncharacterized protein n=1 Tax=Centaurea solstitialis TaxID=347529 RepID=A0AA38U3A0_9ASTR|nr:hypothetical protein OSB04_001746 [Centaurea solstitialis]